MSSRSNTKALALAALTVCTVALAGCSDIYFDRRETIAPWSGNAVAQNKVVQMVDPWPPYAADRNIAFDGVVMRSAVVRYRAGKVTRPCNPATSAVVSAQCNANSAQNIDNSSPVIQQGQGNASAQAPSAWAGSQQSQSQARP